MVEPVRNLHLVLIIGVMCVGQTMTEDICPYTDPKCKCEVLDEFLVKLSQLSGANWNPEDQKVICKDLPEIPLLNRGSKVIPVKSLTFYGVNITRISNTSLPPLLRDISIVHTIINDISDDAFNESMLSLLEVRFSDTQVKNLPNALHKLSQLNTLTIRNTRTESWDNSLLEQAASNLERITLINVSLSAWPGFISHFHELNFIDLSQNPLKFIPDDAFNSVEDSLKTLDLSSTDLTHVPSGLSRIMSLESLRLSNNRFTNVSELQGITGSKFSKTIYELFLDYIGLTTMPDFSMLIYLHEISLSGNGIEEIPTGSLPVSLTILRIAKNRLSSVPKDIARLSKLDKLDLSGNLIEVIEPNLLPPSLTMLDLDFNNVRIITNTTFTNLNNLFSLDINSNPISEISPAAFSDFKLSYLEIKDTQLMEIPMALTLLGPRTSIYWTSNQSLSCPCPAPSKIVGWFKSLEYPESINPKCSNGETLSEYLNGKCGQT